MKPGIRSLALVTVVAVAAPAVFTGLAAQQGPAREHPRGLPSRPLSLADVVALAVQNNPQTTLAYAQARASAAQFGSARGRYFPTISVTPTVIRSQSISPIGRNIPGSLRTTYGPSASLNFLLLDFGGRGGTVGVARAAEVAADYSEDVAVQNTVLQAESAFFNYNSARDQLDAQRQNVATAAQNLDAAQQRMRVGLATIADTLQAATALSQAQLALLSAEGDLQTGRGNLAAAMGLSADMPFTIAVDTTPPPVGVVSESVDSLIARAVRDRPDLSVARASTAGARQQIKVARSAEFPSLTFGATGGHTTSDPSQFSGTSYALTFGASVPVFNGGAYQYDVQAARALADAALAREDVTRVQVANQVFTSFNTLQTSAARVRTSAVLLASATQSEEVARGRYNEGVGTFLDLLTAQGALASARSQNAQTRWSWYTALGQLAHDVGTLDKAGHANLRLGPLPQASPPLPSGPR